jgi:hypothetical protein
MDNIENVSFESAPEEAVPICPFCKQQLDTIWVKSDGMGFKGQRELCMSPLQSIPVLQRMEAMIINA